MSSESVKLRQLNPQVRDLDVGIRELRTVKVYPLGVSYQLEMTDLLSEAIAGYISARANEDIDMASFISFAIGLVRNNIDKFMGALTDDGPDLLSDMTNMQLSELLEIVIKENYEDPAKNFQSLLKNLFPAEILKEAEKKEEGSGSPRPRRQLHKPMDTK